MGVNTLAAAPEQLLIDPNAKAVNSATTATRIAVVAVAYLVTAKIGLEVDAIAGFATLVWPASGIALAAMLLGGYRLWPAVAIGAFAVNLLAGAPILTALGIAAGNTAEAVAAAYLLFRFTDFRKSLERPRDVVALIVLAAGLSTMISASVGVTSLFASGIISADRIAETWRAWWVGDLIGDLLVAPLILVWATYVPARVSRKRTLETVSLSAAILISAFLVFGMPGSTSDAARGQEYLLFPPLIWAALRFGVRGAITGVIAVASIAVVATAFDAGPFLRPELHESLFALQIFMGVSGATFLIFGATISEKKRTENDLREARERAESANKAKAGFLAVVSHELRTPLNAISGYLDMLSLEIDGPLTENQRKCVNRIAQSQRHLLSLIEDVLGFAQVEAGRLSFVISPVRVHDVMMAVESIVGAELQRKNLTLKIAEPRDELFVLADADKLRQALLNMVSNAMKFTPVGGHIEISAMNAGDRVQIAVEDSGVGIPAAQLDRVFDPFFQVEQGDTRRYAGLGLGLSIVRDVILAMDGDVRIESTEGQGTTVSIELPLASRIGEPEPFLGLFRSGGIESPVQ